MAEPIRKADNPVLWEKLHQGWLKEKKRGYVVGPGGINYRAIPTEIDIVIFVPESGIDSKYGETSGGVVSK